MKRTKPSLRVSVETLPPEGLALAVELPAEHFPQLREMNRHSAFRFARPVRVGVRLTPHEEVVEAAGRAETDAGMHCSRCLNDYEARLRSEFSLIFSPRPASAAEPPLGPDIIDLEEEDLGLHHYDGSEIDLTEAVQEQILLALPMRPLCSEDCRGLCPGCGADRNREPCTCSDAPKGGPFEVLRNLKMERGGGSE